MTAWTTQELIAVSASRLLADDKVVFAGVGMPLVASVLAKRLHAPNLTIVLEGGIVGPRIRPGQLPVSTNEMRCAPDAAMLTDITDIFLLAQRGYYDYGFLGTAQVDQFGNINTSFIGHPDAPKVRLPGTGGANDIATSCNEVFIVTTHERRRFVETVDFVTSPGWLGGGDQRREAGLPLGGPSTVLTDLARFTFDPQSRRMVLTGLQPGVDVDTVQDNTGFEVICGEISELEPPKDRELSVVRAIDPDRAFTG